MTTLNNDVLRNIGSFLDSNDLLAFTSQNRAMRESNYPNLKMCYKVHFGSLTSDTLDSSGSTLRSLLSSLKKQPDAAVDHNVDDVPNSRLERWKWLVGLENSLDKKVRENYENRVELLRASKATSIIQLKNQLIAFWHSNKQIKDYETFKSRTRAEALQGKIHRLFFKCVSFLLRLYYKPSPSLTSLLVPLKSRSEATFATIGAFELNDKFYSVVAFHPLVDEVDASKDSRTGIIPQFGSSSYGRTIIGIQEQNQLDRLTINDVSRRCPHFGILISRKENTSEWLSSEDRSGHGRDPVDNSKRHLTLDNHLKYQGGTNDPNGSDRLLDQKLTQVMVEMVKQNEDIISLQASSNRDELYVLTAGGFTSTKRNELINELAKFREDKEHKLFPPYRDCEGITVKFYARDLGKKVVHFSRDHEESWDEILEHSTILHPGAAVLPEYWVKKPNIV